MKLTGIADEAGETVDAQHDHRVRAPDHERAGGFRGHRPRRGGLPRHGEWLARAEGGRRQPRVHGAGGRHRRGAGSV